MRGFSPGSVTLPAIGSTEDARPPGDELHPCRRRAGQRPKHALAYIQHRRYGHRRQARGEDEHGHHHGHAHQKQLREAAPARESRGVFRFAWRWARPSRLQPLRAFSACCRRRLSVAVGDSAWLESRTTETAAWPTTPAVTASIDGSP
jgi:hypothetical protein